MSKLTNGLIMAGSPCPFENKCSAINIKCPKTDDLKTYNFSCALARGFDILERDRIPCPKKEGYGPAQEEHQG